MAVKLTRNEKINVFCPKCGEKNEVLWFPREGYIAKVKGTTGSPQNKFFGKAERVIGNCKDCGHKFKPDDLD